MKVRRTNCGDDLSDVVFMTLERVKKRFSPVERLVRSGEKGVCCCNINFDHKRLTCTTM